MNALLIEIGCEELPAGSVSPMVEHLGAMLHAALSEAGVAEAAAAPALFATPRRLAVLLAGVAARQPDQAIERRGPAVAAAWQDGVVGGTPTRALEGFVKGAGATLDDLGTVETDKGPRVLLRMQQPGRDLASLVDEALQEALRTLPMPRRMRWGDTAHEFLRPVSWLVALHGADVLPLSLLGLSAGRDTYGHRAHAPGPHAIATAADYPAIMQRAHVVADIAERREWITDGVQREAAALGGTPVADDELIDEVTALVEWPVALAGRFEERFLEIPQEALIQTMQENQRYFALLDQTGRLMPAFVTIANLASSTPQVVIDGNERVIRPRFEDTMFFWRQDLRTPLSARRAELDRVLFEKRLGSVGDKVARVERLAAELAPRLGADAEAAARVAGLAKCDLVTELVKELPKMQGIAGHHYARRENLPPEQAQAIEQHYWPKQSGAPIPVDALGRCVALADRLDTLVGIFGIGQKPTGTKDPYALRRAAIAIVRLLTEGEHSLDLRSLIEASAKTYEGMLPELDIDQILDFLRERLRAWLISSRGEAVDVVDAVLSRTVLDPADIAQRVAATRRFRQADEAASLAAASKRVGNLLRKADEELELPDSPDRALFVDAAERSLADALERIRPQVDAALQAGDYAAAMSATAALAEPVDRYFDEVLVNAEQAELRRNRLATLAGLHRLCNAVVDLSQLQPERAEA